MTEADKFALAEYRDLVIYRELAKRESVPEFRAILEQLIKHEEGDYAFWLKLAERKHFRVNPLEVYFYVFTRKIFGLTFTAKLVELRERDAIHKYRDYAANVGDPLRGQIEEIMVHEKDHERHMINQIKEDKVRFIGSIILGLNDGLIELSGALVGFASAISDPRHVAILGFITGVAASLSMASSSYMQAKHERGKNPLKAALYTGAAYLIVVIILVLPFLLLSSRLPALITMAFLILLIIATAAFYISVIFDRSFRRQFAEMVVFSVGVAFVTFLIGSFIRNYFGIEL